MWRAITGLLRPQRRALVHLSKRLAHSTSRDVPISYPAICVWGANTGVGKTLISAGLVASAVRNQVYVQYVKPVQTGYPEDSDSRLVAAAAAHVSGSSSCNDYILGSSTLHTYKDPVSPHLAAAAEGRTVADEQLVAAVTQQLQQFTAAVDAKRQQQQQPGSSGSSSMVQGLSVVETAGGVTSPGPSGNLQGDILRPLSLPALLVGDPHLGGISTTLSSYESLLLRGHVAEAVVMMTEDRYNNITAVRHHLRHAAAHRLGQALPVLSLPLCRPPLPAAAAAAASSGSSLVDEHLATWLSESQQQFDELLLLLLQHHQQRLDWLTGAAAGAAAQVWWPFTQHAQLPNKEVTVVDARAGENWLTLNTHQQQSEHGAGSSSNSSSSTTLTPLHDAASSWWTQTAASCELQVEVTRAVAAAAGRYMHVMWPQVAHAPGLELTRLLLSPPLNPNRWANRVFFSDDGSTAIEVALKMAFRKFMLDHDMLQDNNNNIQLEVLALQNSYHGDTHGAMDCAAASPFNGRLQTPWYSGRGLFLQPPYLQLQKGVWRLQAPQWLTQQQQQQGIGSSSSSDDKDESSWVWESQQEVFDISKRNSTALQQIYHQHIAAAIDAHERPHAAATSSSSSRRRLGALLIEPVLQGAGGMLFVDPLFQNILVKVVCSRNIPVIFDEVFTGCWRLGSPTAAALLGATPDIACYAKLLTGGAAPLAVTVTSEPVFDAFKGPSKVEALLHGHSYTAYPLGCAAAVASLTIIQDPNMNPNVCTTAIHGRCQKTAATAAAATSDGESTNSSSSSSGGNDRDTCPCKDPCHQLLPQWDDSSAVKLSHHPRVKGVVVLGSVLAVELNPHGEGLGGGYASSAAVDVVAALRHKGVAARPLGPVVYIMVTPTTSREKCEWLMSQLSDVLDMTDGWGKTEGDWVII